MTDSLYNTDVRQFIICLHQLASPVWELISFQKLFTAKHVQKYEQAKTRKPRGIIRKCSKSHSSENFSQTLTIILQLALLKHGNIYTNNNTYYYTINVAFNSYGKNAINPFFSSWFSKKLHLTAINFKLVKNT